MMKRILKALSLFCATILLMVNVPQTASAADLVQDSLVGVSYAEPFGKASGLERGQSYPTVVKPLTSTYSMSGDVNYGADLYTNYRFTGKTSYHIFVKNTGKNTISVMAYKYSRWGSDELLRSEDVLYGGAWSFSVDVPSKDDQIYLYFRNYDNLHYKFTGSIS